MNAARLRAKIGEARQRVAVAERELDDRVRALTDGNGGEKTIVAKLLDGAFDALRDARRQLGDLTVLLDADAAAPRPPERNCPGCAAPIGADARLCGLCGTQLA